MRKIRVAMTVAFVLAVASMVGCGSRAGGGVGGFFQTVGGAPGAACNPQAHNEGCNVNVDLHSRVACDGATSAWKLIAPCSVGQTCTTATDQAAPGTGKMVSVCVAGASAGQGDSGTSAPLDASGGGTGPVVQDVSVSAPDASGGTVVMPDVGGGGSGSVDVSEEPEPAKDVGGGGEPSVYKGCLDPKDDKYLKSLADDQAAADQFAAVSKDCTLSSGCISKSGEAAQISCIKDCVKDKTGLTDACAHCQAKYRAFCGFKKCLTNCMLDATSKGCLDCISNNCDPLYAKCAAGNESPASP